MPTRIATWNINSVRLRSGMVAEFLKGFEPDILCLQEIKCSEAQFPFGVFRGLGYDHVFVNGHQGHHGVCIASRIPLTKNETWDFNNTGEARHVSAAFKPRGQEPELVVEVHNFYVPAGGDVPDANTNPKFKAKLAFLDAMTEQFGKLDPTSESRRILVGDLNVAPLEQDVWSHKKLLKVVSHTPIEIERFIRAQKAHDWQDVMRRFVPDDEKLYTWWSYRSKDWRTSDRGRRLDHVWATPKIADKATALTIHRDARDFVRPSDHVPVIVDFDL